MTPEELQAQLAELRRVYARQLPDKVKGLEAACEALLGAAWDEAACAAAYRSAHSMAGSGGTYGFPELGETARALEGVFKASLEARTAPDEAARARARELVRRLRELAESAARA
jgi:chemotaxis protein histidine kinase CheA